MLHCNAKGGAKRKILATKKEALQMVVRSREDFLKKERTFENYWQFSEYVITFFVCN